MFVGIGVFYRVGSVQCRLASRTGQWSTGVPTVLIQSEFLIWNYPCWSSRPDLMAQARKKGCNVHCMLLKQLRFCSLCFLNKLETKNYPQRSAF